LFETTANQGSSGNLSSNQFVTLFLFSILYLLIINELQRNLAFVIENNPVFLLSFTRNSLPLSELFLDVSQNNKILDF
ncbi:hypothetical protein, partial [Hoylesella pleuritidis]|uniref:hypothetical protein n=1 Tax=Hoylesella pleuritidis TaxID=407975 RepID=UPI0028D6F1EA